MSMQAVGDRPLTPEEIQQLRSEMRGIDRTQKCGIDVASVAHWFGSGENRTQVLFDNHLQVWPGEIVIMTGPSGSGKTTLLTLIGGLRSLQEGRIEVLGEQLRDCSDHELVNIRKQIGFIFQRHNLFGSLTALENVRMAIELLPPKGDTQNQAIELLTRLELGHRVHYRSNGLSGGQSQRVAIARALVNRPGLVLADEPTAALDANTGQIVMKLFKELGREEGTTFLIVTHDNRILQYADRIVRMEDGHIVANVLVKESILKCDLLRRCVFFANLTPDALVGVANEMERERFENGSRIITQGEHGDKFYLIWDGKVNVLQESGMTARQMLTTLSVGDYFGERALITDEPRNATIQATGDVEVLSLAKDKFQKAMESSKHFVDQIRRLYFQG